MLERNVNVTHIPVKNSFVYVSKNLDKLANGSCVKLTFEDGSIGYFSVTNSISTLKDNCIGISSLYCKTLGIEEDELVLLSEISNIPIINSIIVTPISESDYDVIESLAENIQSTLLNQIRTVYSGQKFVIWIGNSISVTVIVDDVKPVSPGILGFLTEVHIKPLKYNEKPQLAVNNNFEKIKKGFQNIYSKINIFHNGSPKVENELNKYFNYQHGQLYRLIRITDIPSYKTLGNYLKPFNIFTTRNYLSSIWTQDNFISHPCYCSISLLTDDVFPNRIIYTRLFVLEDFLDAVDSELNNLVFVDDIIFAWFNGDLGTKVVLKLVEKVPHVKEINICTNKNLINIEDEFKKYLSDHSDQILLLNHYIPLKIGNNIVCLEFVPIESEFVIVNNDSFRNFKYHVVEKTVVLPVSKARQEELSVDQFLGDISNYSDIIESSVLIFGNGCDRFENVLIIGKPGTGKTTILKCIAVKLQTYPYFIYTKTINCRSFRGKTPDSLIRELSKTFSTLIAHQPSLLILDDLHNLCENIPSGETAPNSLYYNRISEMLHNFFKLFCDPNQIGICASAESIEKLNKNIYSSRGSHLFKNLYKIEELNKVDRFNLLQHLFKDHRVDDVNFDDLSVKTEGFVVHDFIDFYNKTFFEIYKEGDDDDNLLKINQENVDAAFNNTFVLSLQNVNLHSPGDKDFFDVGGLDDVKDILVESLLWPAKYPNIFSEAPLRLQSGLLLYGPPGTGKTLLAGAAAKHCGLRLISVKGPELLSKYIGGSEQAVRDIFQKAQSVRPCILFFDEFDSLAPRRGHDNTGVTDRVVNQLLTELDGVESLTGVCVLAATSRPDLLDPALLRPGRLDRQLLCSLPNKESRLAILTVLAKNLDLEDDTDLEKIAFATECYSGADLQSLLYTAQISTIKESWDNDELSTEMSQSKITQKHLEDALAKAKPSLTKQERLKYERIYTKFKSGSNMEDFGAGTRATLA